MGMRSIKIKNRSGYNLAVTLFEPEVSNNRLLLINSATGVKQEVYFSFAKFFAFKGYTVITYDYYGINLSKPKDIKSCTASMRSWGTEDYNAVTEYIKQHYAHHYKVVLGHSVGALILGMNEDTLMFDRLVFAMTQKAYLGNLDFKIRWMGAVGFGAVQPLLTSVLGYFPAHQLGLGESLPKPVAYDWRTLIVKPRSTNLLYDKLSVDCRLQMNQPTLVLHAEDDAWVTKKGMTTLFAETYPNLTPKYREIKVTESEKGDVGHINFFRSYNKNLWDIVWKNIEV